MSDEAMRSRLFCRRCGKPIALAEATRLLRGMGTPLVLWFVLIGLYSLGLPLALPLIVKLDCFMLVLWSVTILVFGLFLASVAWIAIGHHLNLQRFSEALGLFYDKRVSCDELSKYLCFPLVQRASSAFNWTEGPFLDTHVILCHLSSGPWRQDAAIFYNAIPGLPDFELVPNRSWQELVTSAPSNSLAFKHAAVTDEPFEEQYEIQADDTEAVLTWLGPEQRKLLACYPGWHVQAFEGRVLITRPGMICRNSEWPTLLALTWRMYRIIVPRYREGPA